MTKSPILRWALALALAAVPLAAARAAQPPATQTAPPQAAPAGPLLNPHQPLDGILTGGFVSNDGFRELAGQGYKTYVDLRSDAEIGEGQGAAAEAAGLHYLRIPIAGEPDLDLPRARALDALLDDPSTYPVVIACASGNRSGALMAVEAYWLDGLPGEEALVLGERAGLTKLEPSVRALLGLPPAPSAEPAPAAPSSAQAAADWPAPRQREILEKTKTVRLAPDLGGLSAGERRAVDELLKVGAVFQAIYEDSRHPQAAAARARLRQQPGSDLATLYRLFQGPIATTLDNQREPFLAVDPETPGKNVYPAGVTAAEIETFLAAHPEERATVLGDRTVVRRATAESLAADLAALRAHPLVAGLHPFLGERLRQNAREPDAQSFYAVPYSVAYADRTMEAYLGLLRAADAVEGDDGEFAGYLRNRARDLVSDDYESGDASWVTGRFGKLNAQIGAYETYDDALFGVKTFYSLSLLLRDEQATAEMARGLAGLQDVEDALPYSGHKRIRPDIPIGVYEVIADFGQARGTNTATNLPNDPLHSRRYGRIILMRENILKNPELQETAARRFAAAVEARFAKDLGGEGGFQRTLWHEIGHYLGPERTRDGRPLDQALASWADAVEEMKADLVSLFAVQRLADAGIASPERLRSVQAAGILRTLNSNRPRRDQPYQTMQLAQFNFFLDRGLISAGDDGRLVIRSERYAETVKALLEQVIALQIGGDPAVADAFFGRWTAWTEPLHEAIGKRLREAEGSARFRLVRYGAMGE